MHEIENISNRERLIWACMLSSSRIGANDSCVYALHITSCMYVSYLDKLRTLQLNSRLISTSTYGRRLQMIRIVWVHAFELNWLQQTLLRSARRGAETKLSIKLVHRFRRGGGGGGHLTRETILRARDGDNSLINMEYFQFWKPIF